MFAVPIGLGNFSEQLKDRHAKAVAMTSRAFNVGLAQLKSTQEGRIEVKPCPNEN